MPQGLGGTRWAIAEGYIPGWSHGPEPEMISHETVCILNTGDDDAHVTITVYFDDDEPTGPYHVLVPPGARTMSASTTWPPFAEMRRS